MSVYPTQRSVLLAALGAPAALLVAQAMPQWWGIAALWVLGLAGLMLADTLLAPPPGRLNLSLAAPQLLDLGRSGEAQVTARFEGAGPRSVEVSVTPSANLSAAPSRQVVRAVGGAATARLTLVGTRRGQGGLPTLWARWRGPLGLIWRQRTQPAAAGILVTPDIASVHSRAVRFFARDESQGLKVQSDIGPGGDFQSLKEFQTGMDLRSIDWKQSARHGKLIAREHLAERNHHIILAIDTGRLMSAPTPIGARVDQAINAALLLAFVSLKLGDRVGLFAFDARPRVASGVVAGSRSYPLLQRLAGAIDYSAEETNFTLGLTTLAGRLDRRAIIVVFTDFADPTNAELMIENLGRLMRTHLVFFVVFRDHETEAFVDAEPATPDDVSRAVIAHALLRQRELVIGRLQRLGAQIIEAASRDLGLALVDRYLDAKRRNLV